MPSAQKNLLTCHFLNSCYVELPVHSRIHKVTKSQTPTSNFQFPISKRKRPFVVTLLILMVLSYTTLSWYGFAEALRSWDFLQSLPLTVPPWYLALRNVFWGLMGVPLIWGLWVGRRWAWLATQVAVSLYTLYYWLDRTLLADPSVSLLITGRWPFALGLTGTCLVYAFLVLRLPMSRRFFKV